MIENGKSLPVLSSVADADRNTGWFYDTEHKRLYVKTAVSYTHLDVYKRQELGG